MPFGSSLIYITHNTACCEVETITMICAPAFVDEVLISATYQVSVSLFLLVFRVCSLCSALWSVLTLKNQSVSNKI